MFQTQGSTKTSSLSRSITALITSWSARAVLSCISRASSVADRHSQVQFLCLIRSRLSKETPVLNPLPTAGQGLCPFHMLPKYQSLWFSTSARSFLAFLKCLTYLHSPAMSAASIKSVSRTITESRELGNTLTSVSLARPKTPE